MLENKSCTCPCGHVIAVPVTYHGDDSWYADTNGYAYNVSDIVCPNCSRRSTGGNWKTGEVTSWITERAAYESQMEYERQSFESDMNEWYGRGEW